jgi:hypothetical protein
LYHLAIRYPDRRGLGEALLRLDRANISLEGASDHGVSEALYLRDPDGNGVELYWDRPQREWPRDADGALQMVTAPLDLADIRAAANAPSEPPAQPKSTYTPMGEGMRMMLRDLRGRLLHLHKVLLDDARSSYEMDRGRVASNYALLQLVINDPWFAWLHALSELVVRIDQTVEPEAPATAGDGTALVDQVERLLTPSETGEAFARRYFEALQRQPAVVLAHAEVRRAIRGLR